MILWHYITALGGLGITAPIGIAITAWLGAAHCTRRALYWCLVFGAAMLVVIASKVAFIGWGIGSQAYDFTGFSGHAARAGAVFPVAIYLLCREARLGWRIVNVGMAALLAMLVAWSRVVVLAHSPAEALLGLLLGLGTAAVFIALAHSTKRFTPNPWLIGLTLLVLIVQPRGERVDSQQWMTALALNLSGHDRPYSRWSWQPTRRPYLPPCPSSQRRFTYLCL